MSDLRYPLLAARHASPGYPLERLDRRPRGDGRPLLCDRRLNDGRGCRPATEDGDTIEVEPEQPPEGAMVSDLYDVHRLFAWLAAQGRPVGGGL